MNMKNIWRNNKKMLLPLFFCLMLCIASLVMIVGGLADYRVNLTSSLPKGIYHLSKEAVKSGDLVSFCLETDNPFSRLAKERGYLGSGSCPSGLKPLLKHLAGIPGDRLEICQDGITLNGRLLSGTKRPGHDSQGRTLPPSLLHAGVIGEGQALVLSQHHSGSFDSRHYGLVPLSTLTKTQPVLIFND